MSLALSEYERKRLENIKENEALLRNLKIPTTFTKLEQGNANRTPLKTHKPKPVKKERLVPTRASARIRGKSPDKDLKRPMPGGELYEAPKKPKLIELLDEAEQKKFLNLMKEFPNTTPTATQETSAFVLENDTALKKSLDKLTIKHEWKTVKMTTSRITAALFHPSEQKLLACATDTDGHLGFWDIHGAVQEDEEPVVYTYKPHTRSITDIHFSPVDNSKLYTSSYDQNLKIFDMNKAEFDTIDLGKNYSLTGFDVSQDGHLIWFVTSDGELGCKDVRSKSDPIAYTVREKKVGCVHLNPVHQDLIAVASNDRTATVMDIRNWSTKEPDALHTFEHGYSVTSAYWSPKGNLLATASYDDYVRLFELDSTKKAMTLKNSIRHNNHTGRWVTNFRARWNTNKVNGLDTQHFVIGNMNQTIDVYSGETGQDIIQLYDAEHITAIPSVVQFHPNTAQPTLLGGNASGRVLCYEP